METRLHAKSKTALSPSLTTVRSGVLQRKCACGGSQGVAGECESCDGQKLSLQRSTQDSQLETRNSGGVPPIVHEGLRSPGQPLDSQTRAFFEPRFGHDFSAVRVHTDGRAVESARAVNALAYTVGSDVVFGNQQYVPHTTVGSGLLAHELAHVVQQSGGPRNAAGNHELEREAERAADVLSAGGLPEVSAGIAPAASPQFNDAPDQAHQEPKPTPQEYISQHTNMLGLNLEEERLASDLYQLAWQSPNHYQFVLDVFKLLDASNQLEVAVAFFKQLGDDSFINAFALREDGRKFLTAVVSYLPLRHSQRFRVEKIVKAGPQNEVEMERKEALEQLEKKGKNVDITMYTSYKGEDLAESQLESIAKSQKEMAQTDEIFPMAAFEDIQGYLEALHEETGATDFVRELHLMGHGTEDRFGFGEKYYTSAVLKEYPTGLNALYMANGGTVYLEGCDVAKGETGRKYIAEIGRIFFGDNKTGFIKGNTCPALDLVGVAMSECEPRTLRWPADLK